jgi:tetratricopeptide (TPR) repeat protein
MSFAKTLIDKGDYEEAVLAATKDIDEGNVGPDPLFDRASAYELLERYAEAVRDFEAAIKVNLVEKSMDPFVLDDAYFSALVAAARAATDPRMLDRYAQALPEGGHLADARDWQKRLRGEMPSLLDRTKDVDAV